MKGRLFGRKKAEPQENPYAQQQAQEEYERMSPYQRARADAANNAPITRPSIPGGIPSGPGPRRGPGPAPGPAQSAQSLGGSTYVESGNEGYGSNRYGNNQGYGANRFDSSSTFSSSQTATPPAGQSGYGGLGGRPNAPAAAAPPQQQQQANDPIYGADQGYAAEENEYADEELTEEQLEEREYRKVKKEQRAERSQGLETINRTKELLYQAEETGMRTLANLGAQGERLNRVETNLNVSASHAKNSEAKAKELKTLNRSMFAVHIENPLTKKSRLQTQEQAILAQSRLERGEREAIRGEAYRDQQEDESFFANMEEQRVKTAQKQRNKKWDFSDDSDEDQNDTERQIQQGMDELGDGVERLKMLGIRQGNKIQAQNGVIDRITEKTDGVTDHVVKNSAKLRTFK